LQKTVSHVRDSLASLLIHPHQTPAKSRSAFIAEATEKCAIKELLPRPSRVSQSRALSLAEPHPLPYHLCMPVYEHFVIRGRGYIIECCELLLAPRVANSTLYTIHYRGDVVCYRLSSSNHAWAVTILTHRGILEAVTWCSLFVVSHAILQV
jgi:hypothetical protein